MKDNSVPVQSNLNNTEPVQAKSVMREFPKSKKGNLAALIAAFLVVLVGVLSGWLLSGSPKGAGDKAPDVTGVETGANEAGLEDTSSFDTEVEGVLEEGGIEGEGTHNLVRDGGPTQSVYLTSAVLDLQSYVGKKVKVWGQTISGRKAGWLVEVGKIRILD